MPDDLDPVATGAPKHQQVTRMGVPPQRLLNLQRQSIHAAAHIGPADRQPDPDARRDRDHACTSAVTIAAARSGATEGGSRTCEPLAAITSIMGSGAVDTVGGLDDTITGTKPEAPPTPADAPRSSSRHRQIW